MTKSSNITDKNGADSFREQRAWSWKRGVQKYLLPEAELGSIKRGYKVTDAV